MTAIITTKHHSETGKLFQVAEIIHNRIVCVIIEGRKVDFGISEVKLKADKALGCEAVWRFRPVNESLLLDKTLAKIAKAAAQAWRLTVKECTKAVHDYVWVP